MCCFIRANADMITVYNIVTIIQTIFFSQYYVFNNRVSFSENIADFQMTIHFLNRMNDWLIRLQSHQHSRRSQNCLQDVSACLFKRISYLAHRQYSSLLHMQVSKVKVDTYTSQHIRPFLDVNSHRCSSDFELTTCVWWRFHNYCCDWFKTLLSDKTNADFHVVEINIAYIYEHVCRTFRHHAILSCYHAILSRVHKVDWWWAWVETTRKMWNFQG